MLEMDSTNWVASYWILGVSHAFNGSPDSALRALENLYRLQPDLPGTLGALLFGYAVAGRWAEAERLKTRIERVPGSLESINDILYAKLAFGDRDGAITAIENSIKRRQNTRPESLCEPIYDLLRSEPRFVRVMQRLGIQKCPGPTPWPIKPPPR